MNAFFPANQRLSHLRALEAEAIHILREVVAVMRTPCLFYSIGKDSTVLLHLARKAFFPGPLPFPLLHVDTGWEFSEMGQFRDRLAARLGLDMRVHINPDGERLNITPFSVGSAKYTDIMKTEALKQALNQYGFDACFGGGRRDEEKARAKERVCPFATRTSAGTPSSNGRNSGSCTTRGSTPARACGYFPCRTGPNWTSGSTSTSKGSRSSTSTGRRCAQWSSCMAR